MQHFLSLTLLESAWNWNVVYWRKDLCLCKLLKEKEKESEAARQNGTVGRASWGIAGLKRRTFSTDAKV